MDVMQAAAVNGGEDWTLAELQLLCTESLTARRATVCCHDKRVLHELLHIDDRYVVSSSPYVNSNITVHMRTQLAEWIFELCVAEECDDSVFPLTMNCIDRLLVQLSPSLKASQFQLVGVVCLFIASKLRDCSESVSLSAKKLAEYSDFSFTSRNIIEWELVVLQALKWDVAAVTAGDFVDIILCQLSIIDVDKRSQRRANVRHHALTFVVLSALDFKFSMYAPSTVAAACVRSAVMGVFGDSWCSRHRLDRRLRHITHTDPELLATCQEQIEQCIESRRNTARADDIDDDDDDTSPSNDSRKRRSLSSVVTPTDVRDISLDYSQSRTS